VAHDDSAKTKTQPVLLIRNIGLLLSGNLKHPILDADTVLAVDGKIAAANRRTLTRKARPSSSMPKARPSLQD
jgi:hypothetical protein